MRGPLLHWLQAHANGRGVVLGRSEVIEAELEAASDVLRQELTALEREGVVEIIAPLPFLVLRLKKWSGRGQQSTFAYSSLLSHNRLIESESYRHDPLLREILETLGETDVKAFAPVLEHYSPQIIRTALRRVRRARGIRKSRTALFRHLLPRLAQAEPERN